jgi:hypothetical protein
VEVVGIVVVGVVVVVVVGSGGAIRVEKSSLKDHLRDLRVDGRMILK